MGTRLTASALGFSVSRQAVDGTFAHPFRPSLAGFGLRFRRGVIIAAESGAVIEPKINGVPISGTRGTPQPMLQLHPKEQNDKGESWACVELEPGPDGVVTAQSRVEIIHSKHPTYSGRAEVGRHPIAMIVWQNNKPALCFATVTFHLRYERFVPPTGGGNVRHFFL